MESIRGFVWLSLDPVSCLSFCCFLFALLMESEIQLNFGPDNFIRIDRVDLVLKIFFFLLFSSI